MQNKILKIFLLAIAFFVVGISQAKAADVYMSTTGTKTTGKSTVGDWSNANCYSNLAAAWGAMSGGDTLTINDGIYSGASNEMNQFNYPPSGPGTGTGDARFTIIKARNIPGQGSISMATPLTAIIDAPFAATNFPNNSASTFCNYIKWEGIRFARNFEIYGNFNHHYFKQCAFVGYNTGMNQFVASIDSANNLLEDCVAYGIGRYSFAFTDYRGSNTGTPSNNICRRCVARLDWANKNNGDNNPIAVFASYYSKGTVHQNTIAIDSNEPSLWWAPSAGEMSGAYYQPNDTQAMNLEFQGAMAVNVALPFFYGAGWGFDFTDVLGVKLSGGIGGSLSSINRAGLYNLATSNFTYTTTQRNNLLIPNQGIVVNDTPVTNSIVSGVACGIDHSGTGSVTNNNFYSAGSGGCITTTNPITTNPMTHGWLYPTRIEAGSALLTGGTSGGQVGPKNLTKIGVDGTFKGDAGWNADTGVSLWPYPMEDWIKAEMGSLPSTYAGKAMPSATRGFATLTGKRLDGINPVTLTSYIWESLGNPIPDEIYGATSDTTAPSAPSGLSVQ